MVHKGIYFTTLFVLLSSCQTVKNIDSPNVEHIIFHDDKYIEELIDKKHFESTTDDTTLLSWGGGGAFTHYISTNEGFFLSSDVSGLWHKADINSKWKPLNTGLSEYEIVALEISTSGNIYLLTSRYLYKFNRNTKTNGRTWQRISPAVRNNRNTVSKFTTTHSGNNGDSICLISEKNLLFCKLPSDDEWKKIIFNPQQKLRAVAFNNNGNALFVGLNNELYIYRFSSASFELLQAFKTPIQMLSQGSSTLKIATQSGLYELTKNTFLLDKLYSVNKAQIKRFICANDNKKCILGLEKNWSSKLLVLKKTGGIWQANANKADFKYDDLLPFRQWQRGLSKSLSLSSSDDQLEHLFFSDYWGAFYSMDGGNTWHEDVSGAVNSVGMDLLLYHNKIYVATMDNGVVSVDTETKRVAAIYPKGNGKLAGHSWQLAANANSLFFTLSPWNNKNNFVGQYNFNTKHVRLFKKGLPESTRSKDAFWGESYARGVVATDETVLVTSDGPRGGLYSLNLPIVNDSVSFSLIGDWTGQQKIYNALNIDKDTVQVSSCNGTLSSVPLPSAEAFAINASEIKTIRTRFCAFDMQKSGNKTYLLGEQNNKAAIVKVEGGRQTTLLETTFGSAFKTLAINPKQTNEIFAATISWSDKADSGAFFSIDDGETWQNISCLLTHYNGVVGAEFNNDGSVLYILQKVGGLITLPHDTLNKACSSQNNNLL